MNRTSEDLTIFTELGLTNLEATVYIAIVKLGKSTVKLIAEELQIARAEAYRATAKLQTCGLIEKHLNNPTSFTAMPVPIGLKFLLDSNLQRQNEIHNKVKDFLQRFQKPSKETIEHRQLYTISYGRQKEKWRTYEIFENVKESADGICPFSGVVNVTTEMEQMFKKALRRGVRMRVITYLPENGAIPKIFNTLRKTGDFEVRYIQKAPSTVFVIVDQKTVHFTVNLKSAIQTTSIDAAATDMLDLFQDYFELKWQSATLIPGNKRKELKLRKPLTAPTTMD